MKAVIHSEKTYLHTPAAVITSGAGHEIDVVTAIAKGVAPASADEVHEGDSVKAVYLEFWYSGVTADKTLACAFVKLPGGAASPTFAEMANMSAYVNKKNVLEFHQGLAPTGGNVVPMFRHWVKIPKGKQRMGLGDKLILKSVAVGTNVNICGVSTYKAYS